MALNKSKRNDALTVHVLVYSACFAWWGLEFCSITFLTHWVTDYFTSRLSSKFWFIELGFPYSTNLYDWAKFDPFKRAVFWRVIGMDQCIHFITLAITYKLLFGG